MKLEVNHLNSLRDDNRVSNLEWTTRSENVAHSFKAGNKSTKGENNPNCKLTNDLVKKIKKDLSENIGICALSKKYFVSHSTISDIKQNIAKKIR